MKTVLFSAKKASRFNLDLLTGPLVGYALLIGGELLMLFLYAPLAAGLFPPTATGNLLFELWGFLPISLMVLFWALVVEKSPLAGLGLIKSGAVRAFFKGYGLGVALLVLSALGMFVTGGARVTGVQFSLPLLGDFLLLALAWTVQSTTEELLARGWLMTSVGARYRPWLGILVSSLFFTILHLGNDGIELIPILDLFLFGILAGLYMVKTGNLWGVSGIHAAWNCFQGSFFSFAVSGHRMDTAFIQVQTQGPSYLSGGAFGVEGTVFSLVVQLAVIAWLVYDVVNRQST